MRRLRWAALGLVVIASACTGDSKPAPAPSLPFAPGGTLRLTLFGWADHEFDSRTEDGRGDYALDPHAESGPGWELMRCCLVRTLMSYNGTPTAEGGSVPRPDLAAGDPRVSADGLTWTFKVKRGIRYAPPLRDVEVSAGDFIRGLERGLSPSLFPAPDVGTGFAPINRDFDYLYVVIRGAEEFLEGEADTISGLEAPDPHTLVVHLTEPSGDLPYRMAMPNTAPIPPNPSDPGARFGIATGHESGLGRFQVGSGPYMIEGSEKLDFSMPADQHQAVEGYVPAISLTLVRNPSWSRAADGLRPAYPDRIELILDGSDEAHDREAADLEAGRIDIAYFVEGMADEEHERLVPKYLADPDLKKRLHIYPADFQDWLALNMAVPPFDDVHVRKAVNWAIDKRAVQMIRGGHLEGDPATHIGLDSLEDNLLVNYDPYETDDFRGDAEAAKAEMRLSKYDRDRDGVCDAEACRAVPMYFGDDDPSHQERAAILQSSFAPIGLRLDVRPVPFDDYFPHVEEPERLGALTESGAFKDFPSGSLYFRGFAKQPGPDQSLIGATSEELTRWGYDVTEVPDVTDRYNRCVTEVGSAQTRCWAELDQHLMEDVVPWVPLTKHNRQRLVSERVVHFSYDQFTTLPALDQIALEPGSEPTALPGPPAGPVPDIPDGVYRFTITAKDYKPYGIELNSEEDLAENTGTTTMTLRDGQWTSVVTANHRYFAPVNMGHYRGSGDRVTWIAEKPFFNAITMPPMTWSFDGTALRFRFVSCGNLKELEPDNPQLCDSFKVFFESQPWVKVG
jgi:ABC-type transport system substrate-binding protein